MGQRRTHSHATRAGPVHRFHSSEHCRPPLRMMRQRNTKSPRASKAIRKHKAVYLMAVGGAGLSRP